MEILYPLLFENNFHKVVWGGNRLKPLKGLAADDEPIGESWEVSAVPKSKSIVKNGPLAGKDLGFLTKEYKELMLGKAVSKNTDRNFHYLLNILMPQKTCRYKYTQTTN